MADERFDVVIVGGGPAGLSAALVLGRARRRVLVIDSRQPRNAPSPAAHSVFTRDGAPPLELLRLGRAQLRPYAVEVVEGEATDAVRGEDGAFTVTLAGGATVRGRRLLLATGMLDRLPEVPGMRELWGTGVLHCPYCHGWEVRDQPLGVYARGDFILDFTATLLGWSRDLVVCSNGPSGLDDEERAKLARHGVGLREEVIARLEGGDDGALSRIVFEDGGALDRVALFVRFSQRQHSDLAERLGCQMTDRHQIVVDGGNQTTVRGVYAAGDIVRPMQQVIIAAADGTHAALCMSNELLMSEFV